MREALRVFVLHACVFGAAARLNVPASRWALGHWQPGEPVVLGFVLGVGSVLATALAGAPSADSLSLPWLSTWVILAGVLGGPRAGLVCASIALATGFSAHALGVSLLPDDWGFQLAVAAVLGVCARSLLALSRIQSAHAAVCSLGFVLGLAWSLVQPLRDDSWPSLQALSGMAFVTALGLWLGYQAFAGLTPRDGPPRFGYGLTRDLLVRVNQSAAQEALAQHALILEHAIEGIALLSPEGLVMQGNPALGRFAGSTPEALLGKSWLELAPRSETQALREAFTVARVQGRAVIECVLKGHEAALPVELTLIRDVSIKNQPAGFHLLARDLRERKATARFEHLALHDQLTGLPNRRALLDRLESALQASPGRPVRLAVLLFDVNEFKRINDTLGHAAGDALLKHTAAQMSRVVRPTDTLARLGGDEFVLIARGVDSLHKAQLLAERFQAEAARSVRVRGKEISVELCVGIALAEQPQDACERILERADRAMYVAKDKHRAQAKKQRETKPLFALGRRKA
jgi:diguanylate cyclase (GGDEF)-like protein/PAS domain S-box-containing protein